MEYLGARDEIPDVFRQPFPRYWLLLPTSSQRSGPTATDFRSEGVKGFYVAWDCIIVEVTLDYASKPFSHPVDVQVSCLLQYFPDFFDFAPQLFRFRYSQQLELPIAAILRANVRET